MLTPESSRARKRSRSPASGDVNPHSKRRHSPFWDSLSRIWLTPSALRELDRRNSPALQPAPTIDISVGSLATSDSAIRRFARHGGPDLTDVRSVSYPLCFPYTANYVRSSAQDYRSSQRPSQPQTKSSGRSSLYDKNFEQSLTDHCVFGPLYKYPDGRSPQQAHNVQEVKERLRQPHASLSSFGEDDFVKFQQDVVDSFKESGTSDAVLGWLEGTILDRRYRGGRITFFNFKDLIDVKLTAAVSDLYYGARPEQINRRIREQLSDLIEPSTQTSLPAAPNFFLAAKGEDCTPAVARRQAIYDAALGARAIQALESFGIDQTVFDNRIKAISSTYISGALTLYGTHMLPPVGHGAAVTYVTTRLNAYALIGDAETCQKGLTAFRNAILWTKEVREAAIRTANQRFSAMPSSPARMPSLGQRGPSNISESDTSADELAR
ncbi:hypothetical protein BU26DRAFT_497955 [Trematosphaeria pertusa]|uniref:Uncharacterized protein n=1 Tax=Trematosphaeria pertusa TaxID=390896 RepID=A0A6A6HQH3_9PLEO|nr:uncharacterized protein BU26DRAFT_497955 [Trematosphaeria pertusa]KAF2240366.1 hypothetical protein BU26DRAFT_497955 [Trematosphaeria pertusa]